MVVQHVVIYLGVSALIFGLDSAFPVANRCLPSLFHSWQ